MANLYRVSLNGYGARDVPASNAAVAVKSVLASAGVVHSSYYGDHAGPIKLAPGEAVTVRVERIR